MDAVQRMKYLLGRTIAINLPARTSRLNPTEGDLRLIARRFGLGVEQARSALAFFNANVESIPRSEQWRTFLRDKARDLEDVVDLRSVQSESADRKTK